MAGQQLLAMKPLQLWLIAFNELRQNDHDGSSQHKTAGRTLSSVLTVPPARLITQAVSEKPFACIKTC
jgi:hypothetical protein